MKKLLLFSTCLALTTITLTAQKAQVETHKLYKGGASSHQDHSSRIRCSTMEADARLRQVHPEMGTMEDFEIWLQKAIKENEANSSNKTGVVKTLPTIVHIIHNGQAVGTGTNISQAQVNSQFTILNQDFRRTNPDASNTPTTFTSAATDTEIEFCPAVVDPQGNILPEPGIHRVNRNTAGFSAAPYSDTYIDNTIKPATSWDPTKYFNIWVLDLDNSLLGYAQFPSGSGLPGMPTSGGPANTDGVVILYNAFGNVGNVAAPYNKGRTATHEVGHWLGLKHIWGDATCGNDFCADTPTAEDANYNCPTHPFNVGGCTGNTTGERFMNYMDYTPDACMNLFTNNQKSRMTTVLDICPRRASLVTSTACQTSTVAVANFTAAPTQVCVGNSTAFTFTGSAPAGTTYAWSFPGGTPATSTAQNPTVTYSTIGTYNVTLVATGGGGSDTETKTNYINVVDCQITGCDTVANVDGADTLAIYLSNEWGYISGHNNFGDIAKADFFNYTGTNPVNLTGASFGFGRGATNSATTNVQVKVWANNAGVPGAVLKTENVLLQTIETDVAAGDLTDVNFATPLQISAPFFLGVQFAYAAGDTVAVITNRNGNTPAPGTAWEQWSDNTWHAYSETPASWGLNLSHLILPFLCQITGVEDAFQGDVNLYPNPNNGSFVIEVKNTTAPTANLAIYAIQGQEVYKEAISLDNAVTTKELNLRNLAAGTYFMRIEADGKISHQKFVIQK